MAAERQHFSVTLHWPVSMASYECYAMTLTHIEAKGPMSSCIVGLLMLCLSSPWTMQAPEAAPSVSQGWYEVSTLTTKADEDGSSCSEHYPPLYIVSY